jgi:hypothetical protein
MDPPCSEGCLFVVNLVGAGRAGQSGIRLELVYPVLRDVSGRWAVSPVSASTVLGSGAGHSRDFIVAETTGQAIGHADSTGDLAAADGNGTRHWS